MEHLLKCPMRPQECTAEDLIEYNEAARQEEELEPAIPKRNFSLDLLCCCIVQLLEGSVMVLHVSGSHILTLDGLAGMWPNREGSSCYIYLVLSILAYTSLLIFGDTIPANKYQSST